MTVEELKVRLEYLNGERVKVQESFLALNGHINEVAYQLEQEYKKESEEKLKLEQVDESI